MLLYVPMGMALAFTMMLGIGVFLLLVDLFMIGYWMWTGNKPNGGEFPIGFFVVLYSSAAVRVWMSRKMDWDETEFLPGS